MPASREEYEALLASLPEESRKSYEELLGTLKPWETLDPELAEYIEITDRSKMTVIRHPLVYAMMYAPGVQDGQLNDLLRRKQEVLAEYAAEENWWGYIFLHERPWRLHALLAIESNISDPCKFWDLVGDVWTDSENISQNYDDWHTLLHDERPCRESIMDEEERAFLAKLPEQIKIYRGAQTSHSGEYGAGDGFSWSLDRAKGLWFAQRYASLFEGEAEAQLLTGKVNRTDVIAYKGGRGEKEIIVLPEDVEILSRKSVAG